MTVRRASSVALAWAIAAALEEALPEALRADGHHLCSDSGCWTNLLQRSALVPDDDSEPALLQQQDGRSRRVLSAAVTKELAPSSKDLVMVHMPCNFGHTIERDALMAKSIAKFPGLGSVPDPRVFMSFHAKTRGEQWKRIRATVGEGGEVWGMMNPDLRTLSNITGCDMYYTPQQYWPEDLAASYFGNKTVFAMLRNPYDKLVNEFRMQLMVYSSVYSGETRTDVSRREGNMEKEKEPYTTWYNTCDLNAWIKAEIAEYQKGDKFRGNCHMLPQAEFFRGKYGAKIAIDVARIPDSFNKVMKEHGYSIRMGDGHSISHNVFCEVSAWDLDEVALKLIQEVYAEDFELNCKHFGICGVDKKECVCNVPTMCGNAPADYCATRPK